MDTDTSTATLATPANMHLFAGLHPGRYLPSGGYVEGRRCFAYSPETGEQCSADAGAYWTQPDDQPLTDSEGEPMVLAVSEMRYFDALTGELV